MISPADNSLFAGLSREEIQAQLVDIQPVALGSGETLFRAGDPGDELFLVLSGSLRAHVALKDRPQTLAVYNPGDFFGELAILGGDTRSATVDAIKPSTVLPIPQRRFAQILERFPRVVDNITRTIARNLVRTTRSLQSEITGSVVVLIDVTRALGPQHVKILVDSLGELGRSTAVVSPRPLGETSVLLAGTAGHVEIGSAAATMGLWFHLFTAVSSHSAVVDEEIVSRVQSMLRERDIVLACFSVEDHHLARHFLPLAQRVFVVGDRDSLASIPPDLMPDRSNGIRGESPTVEVVAFADSPTERRRVASTAHGMGLPLPSIYLSYSRDTIRAPSKATSVSLLVHADAHAHRGLGRFARAIAGTRVGIALGAGGARGFAHIGVLRYLEQRGLPIDAVAGSSIGSLVAAMQALGLDSDAALSLLHQWLRGGYRGLLRPRPSAASVFGEGGLKRVCEVLFGDTRFIDLPTPLAVAVSDLVSGSGKAITHGPVYRAVQASCSIPALFPPVRFGDLLLVDGGVTDPLPVAALSQLHADVTIAVNISFSPDDLREWAQTEGGEPPERLLTASRRPNLVEAYHASFSMSIADKAAERASSANVVIRPRFRVTSWRAFTEAPEQVQRGYEAAAAAETDLRRAIPWLASDSRVS